MLAWACGVEFAAWFILFMECFVGLIGLSCSGVFVGVGRACRCRLGRACRGSVLFVFGGGVGGWKAFVRRLF